MNHPDTRPQPAAMPACVGVLGASADAAQGLRADLETFGIELRPLPAIRDYLALSRAQRLGMHVLLVHLPGFSDGDLDSLGELADISELPLVFNESELEGRSQVWTRRLAGKIAALARSVDPASAQDHAPTDPPMTDHAGIATPHVPAGPSVWVLGASFGGPEAVKRFLSSMPSVPNAIFLLAQHIGDGFIDLLASQLNRSTAFTVSPAAEGGVLRPGHVYVAPVNHSIRVEPGDTLRLIPDLQRRHYRPCIDALMQEVARAYTLRAGAVIFSGMGNDGMQGAQAIAQAGGEVWVQSKASCSVSSMPDSVAETGVASRRGTPEELSAALVQFLAARQQAHA